MELNNERLEFYINRYQPWYFNLQIWGRRSSKLVGDELRVLLKMTYSLAVGRQRVSISVPRWLYRTDWLITKIPLSTICLWAGEGMWHDLGVDNIVYWWHDFTYSTFSWKTKYIRTLSFVSHWKHDAIARTKKKSKEYPLAMLLYTPVHITRLLGQTTTRCNFPRVTVYTYSRWHDKRRKWRNIDSSCHLIDRIRYGFGPLKATRKVAQTKIYGKMVPLSRNEDEKIYENPEDV